MRRISAWRPSKYVLKRGRLIGSRDPHELAPTSRLVADLVAGHYDEKLRKHANGRLLDLGCGKVPLYIAYKDYVQECTCADWPNTPHASPHVDVICDLSRPLPFGDAAFDTIILANVLEHLPEPALFWREAARVLAVGGKIIMNVPFYYRIHEAPYDYFRYTEFALRRFVANARLDLLEIEALGGAPEILADVFAKNVVRVPGIGPSLALFTQWTAAAFRRTRPGKRLSTETSRLFPLHYFLVARKAG